MMLISFLKHCKEIAKNIAPFRIRTQTCLLFGTVFNSIEVRGNIYRITNK